MCFTFKLMHERGALKKIRIKRRKCNDFMIRILFRVFKLTTLTLVFIMTMH